ncbi:hypothetical protein HPP92_018212 [Vanilla planifolia]|uniref:Homeobox domain-containing protein n=1 Tax=Vanilla planifolia TaxID=51239 RepID=A0A835QFY6_VANPL|nr:hypothetical protein HPP92_018212 [Vanilla planifolia]
MRSGGDGAPDARLVLRLGCAGEAGKREPYPAKSEPRTAPNHLLPPGPSLTLGLSETKNQKPHEGTFSEELERFSPRGSDGEEEREARKKLRLTKEQSALLEDRFKEQSTLNPKQKLTLAEQLNLRPRQVEVWFQNRRARTKLKQTEVDCEFLRRCCETLADENRRLQRELQELKAIKLSTRRYMQLPAAATLAVCPSCERAAAGAVADESKTGSLSAATAAVGSRKTLFLKTHFADPAAC